MKWSVAGEPYPVEFFGSFVPEEVLYDFDGPRIFAVSSAHGDRLLVYQCDEDENASRFVVVPCDTARVDALKTGRCSVRNALAQPWTWLVDQPHGQPVLAAWRALLTSVPAKLLPGDCVMLSPTMAPGPGQQVASTAAQRRRGTLREFPVLGI